MKQNIDKVLQKKGFSADQIREIKTGLAQKLEVSRYAKKEYIAIQMYQIRLGLQEGLPVELYTSGYCSLTLPFKYTTLTFFGATSHSLLLEIVNTKCSPYPGNISTSGLASSAFARHYSQNLG